MGLKGVDLVTAFTIMAELGDLSRFDPAPQFMAYQGVVPGEDSKDMVIGRVSLDEIHQL